MHKALTMLTLLLASLLVGCGNSSIAPTSNPPPLPPPSNNGTVPATVSAAGGYKVSVFAAPGTSTKPDSIVQIGQSVFIGFGDTVNPDGTPGPGASRKLRSSNTTSPASCKRPSKFRVITMV